MRVNLKGKNVLLGVTGSIAAYKACEVAREFVKSGANVNVVMSSAARRFVSPLTFEALTGNEVLTEDTESWSSRLNHIDIGKDADVFIIAPATANTINKLSKGIADTLLLQCALAYNGPVLVAPAANTNMIQNHYTSGSIKMLQVNDIEIIKSQSKLLACGDVGDGALAEPKEIYWQGARAILKEEFWLNRRVVVTGGGTREAIDSVRYISNYSSGKMAAALSTALYLKGADVCYITTKEHTSLPQDIYTIDVESANEMLEYTAESIKVAKKGKMTKASLNSSEPISIVKKTPYLFMAAAVSDFRPKYPQQEKIKKSTIGTKWQLELEQNPDILKSLDKDGVITVGFKAETDAINGYDNAKNTLEQKGLDAVCYNLLPGKEGFGTDDNEIIFITNDKDTKLPRDEKLSLSFEILNLSKGLDNEQ